ncbi:MAG: SNF2-related protein, partial [Blastocatellia bacterium]|nr:SNF2-related protein [Blastocatellia bacterium]
MTGKLKGFVSWDELDLNEYGSAQAYMGTSVLSDETVTLAFSQHGDHLLPIVERNLNLRYYGFDPKLSARRIEVAVRRALELDVSAKKRFLQGKQIFIDLPLRAQGTNLYLMKLNKDNYWRQRFPVGALIRPLFLPIPTCEKLFPFQKQGVEWLCRNSSAILADDMGLGKTIQSIMAVRILLNQGFLRQILILCPKSLLANWTSELATWAPELCCLTITLGSKSRREMWASILGRSHIVLTNYEQIRGNQDIPKWAEFDLIIADEAHRTRNLTTKITQALRLINRKRFWALTGTPIERDTHDLATLLSTVDPKRFAPSDGELEPYLLRSRAKPYILRRTKATVLEQLPEILETTETLNLLPRQNQSYKDVIRTAAKSDKGEIYCARGKMKIFPERNAYVECAALFLSSEISFF